MELSLNKKEVACLLLHMTAMRKNIKNVLKSNYGKKEGKEHLNCYDEVKEILKGDFELFDEEDYESNISVGLDSKQLNMLSSFVCIYKDKLKAFLEEAKAADEKENKEQLDLLIQVKGKIENV
ncbi:hypothetical protein ABE096_12500 [Robertmurraya massiliosenegalensis]|uniref:hypothetical protein n=1 Tax=Robertmurraya TaxID=2837507 RepID=UPI0039A5D635